MLIFLLSLATALAEEPPPEVEPGSTKTIYVVKPGDTLRSIADAHAFLVDDLARWNGLANADRIEVGQELVMWVAPLELAPPPAGQPKPEPAPEPVAAQEAGERARGFVGVQVGPAIAFNPLSPAVMPRVEAGVELPGWERRIRLFVAGTWARPVEEGSAADPRVPAGEWSWRLEQTEITAATGLTLRATGGKVVPELSLGPAIWFHRSVVDGGAGAQSFGETTETSAKLGLYASGGVAGTVGPGELNAQLAFAAAGLGGVITGETTATALTPLVGYRLVF